MHMKPEVKVGQTWLRDKRRADTETWRYKMQILAVFDDLDGARRVVFQHHRYPDPKGIDYRCRKEVKLVTLAYVWTKYTLLASP